MKKLRSNGFQNKTLLAMTAVGISGICGFMEPVRADVTLPFSTTYNCNYWEQGMTLSCDGLRKAGDWTTYKGSKEQITADANNPLGDPSSKGQRHWLGVDNNGKRSNSGGITLRWGDTFNFNYGEHFWVRWYMRFEQGFTWPNAHYFKVLYFRQSVVEGEKNHSAFNIQYRDNLDLYAQVGDFQHHYCTISGGCGFLTNHGDPSRGEWVSYEVYLKRESSAVADDGKLKYWVNGRLVADHSDVTFSKGMSGFLIGSNADGLPPDMPDRYVDYDDIVITTQTPANRDSANNPMIGPIGWNQATPTLEPPSNLSIK